MKEKLAIWASARHIEFHIYVSLWLRPYSDDDDDGDQRIFLEQSDWVPNYSAQCQPGISGHTCLHCYCTATLDETALESITLLNSKVLHQTKIHCIAPVRNVGLESRAAMHLNQLYLSLPISGRVWRNASVSSTHGWESTAIIHADVGKEGLKYLAASMLAQFHRLRK